MTRVLIYHTIRADKFVDLLRPLIPDAELIPCATPAEAEAQIGTADVLFGWRFPNDLFRKAQKLRWVQSMGAGIEDLVGAPLPAGCLLTRVEGLFGAYMSEYAFAYMLEQTMQLKRIHANQADRRWEPFQVGSLRGKRLGVAGAGSIGAEIARRGSAFGMEVWALARTQRPIEGVSRLFTADEVAEFTAGVNYLVSSLPLTPETVGLINPLQMKHGSMLINVGRGATIDEAALLEAVRSGRIEAVLDVFAQEPLPQEHPFWRTPGITVTPHISGPSVPAEVADFFAANFRRFRSGEVLTGLVDRQRGY